MNSKTMIKITIHWALAILRSLFNATVATAWGVAGILLMRVLLVQWTGNIEALNALTVLSQYVIDYCIWFMVIIFLYELWFTPSMPKSETKTKEASNGKQ
jgi:hypothetical protein